MRKFVTLGILFAFFAAALTAEIVVKQDKDGRILISNIPSLSNKKSRKSFKYTKKKPYRFAKSSGTTVIPTYIHEKIRKLAKKYSFNESLIIAVARAESSFNPFAVSHKGAVGIMQLMPNTAKQYGVLSRYNVDQNLEAGVKHLKYLYKKYRKSLPLTLAAYNAGEEAVKKYKGVPPYKETRTYIKRVMGFMGLKYSAGTYRPGRQRIYKVVKEDGRILITDSLPSNVKGTVSVIE